MVSSDQSEPIVPPAVLDEAQDLRVTRPHVDHLHRVVRQNDACGDTLEETAQLVHHGRSHAPELLIPTAAARHERRRRHGATAVELQRRATVQRLLDLGPRRCRNSRDGARVSNPHLSP